MNILIINNCREHYALDAEYVITRILDKIPEKFLVNLDDVQLFDARPHGNLQKKSVHQTGTTHHSSIHVYMDPGINRKSLFSILLLNTEFIGAIHDHIRTVIKPSTQDQEILSVQALPIYQWMSWMYLGIWSPVLLLIRIVHFLIFRFTFLYNMFILFIKRWILNAPKSSKDRGDDT